MAKDKNPFNYIEDYLLTVRSKGCFTVTQNELLEKFNISSISFKEKSEVFTQVLGNLYRTSTNQ